MCPLPAETTIPSNNIASHSIIPNNRPNHDQSQDHLSRDEPRV